MGAPSADASLDVEAEVGSLPVHPSVRMTTRRSEALRREAERSNRVGIDWMFSGSETL